MRPPRIILFWTVVIVALLFVEVAELTRLFTIPFSSAISDPVTFAIGLIFVTIVALVGAIFIGIYVSQRLLSPRGFSPFEEEMLKMRADVTELRRQAEALADRNSTGVSSPPESSAGPEGPPGARP